MDSVSKCRAGCHLTSIHVFVVSRKNWSPSWVVLVGNSLVFFKDPKSQTPSSWVRAQTTSVFNAFIPGADKKKLIFFSNMKKLDVKSWHEANLLIAKSSSCESFSGADVRCFLHCGIFRFSIKRYEITCEVCWLWPVAQRCQLCCTHLSAWDATVKWYF